MIMQRMGCVLSAFLLLCACIFAQTTTGTLVGTVVDPVDAAVPGIQVEVTNVATGVATTTTTGAEGIFRFNSLVPANYTLTIKPATGFKTYTQSNIQVTADEVRALGKITLSIGTITETVSVTAVATPIQTASGENSKLIEKDQFDKLTLKGRDMFGLMVLMPGVNASQQQTTSENSVGSVRINGATIASANFTVDGITDLDTGSNGTTHFEPNMDSIAEMRVLTSNYQAEYAQI